MRGLGNSKSLAERAHILLLTKEQTAVMLQCNDDEREGG